MKNIRTIYDIEIDMNNIQDEVCKYHGLSYNVFNVYYEFENVKNEFGLDISTLLSSPINEYSNFLTDYRIYCELRV